MDRCRVAKPATCLTQMLEPYAGQIVIAAALASDFGPTDRSLGLLAAASGDLDAAEGHFHSALELCGRLQARPRELRTRLRTGLSQSDPPVYQRGLGGLASSTSSGRGTGRCHSTAPDFPDLKSCSREARRGLFQNGLVVTTRRTVKHRHRPQRAG